MVLRLVKRLMILALLCRSSVVLARLDFTQLKGMQEHIQLKPEYEYLDPIAAFNFQRQSFLINLVNYPEEESEPGKFDPIAAWVGSVFVAPQNTGSPTFFQVSPLAKKFARFLGPTAIGSILSQLVVSESGTQRLTEGSPAFEQLKQDLKRKIENDPEFKENLKIAQSNSDQYQQQMNELEGSNRLDREGELILMRDQKKTQRKECVSDPTQFERIDKELKEINEKIASVQKENKKAIGETRESTDYKKLREKRDQFKYDKKYLDSFLDKLLSAWLAEKSEKRLEDKNYPIHVVEKALMALAWMNTEDRDKAQFVALYGKIPELLKVPVKVPLNGWINQTYNALDYENNIELLLKTKTDLKERAQYLLKHRELAAFLSHGYSFFDPAALPEIGYKNIHYESKTQGQVTFSDCMDSSVLNFLAIALKNPKTSTFDPELLREKLKDNFQYVSPGFLEFAKQHPNLNTLDTTQAHEKWAPLVSDLNDQGIHYVRKGYELDTQVSNIFKIMDHVLFNNSLNEITSNAEKMNKLCQLLSHSGREMDWIVQGGKKEDLNIKNTDVTLQFFLNGSPYFDWKISNGHSEIHTNTEASKQLSWKKGLAEAMVPLIEQQRVAGIHGSGVGHQELLGLVNEENLGSIIEELNTVKGSVRSLNLDSNESQLRVFEESLKNHLVPTYPLLKTLQNKLLATNDWYTQFRLSVAQADSDYPLGDPNHVIGKPEINYTRLLNHPELKTEVFNKAKSLDGLHKQLFEKSFEKAWVDPRGGIWGAVVKKKDGSNSVMDYRHATAYCESIHAHLPTKEQWAALSADMSHSAGQGYIPQYLNSLHAHSYWSSSLYSISGDCAYKFGGTFADMGCSSLQHRDSVRCIL